MSSKGLDEESVRLELKARELGSSFDLKVAAGRFSGPG